jgi:hypothetical protein
MVYGQPVLVIWQAPPDSMLRSVRIRGRDKNGGCACNNVDMNQSECPFS